MENLHSYSEASSGASSEASTETKNSDESSAPEVDMGSDWHSTKESSASESDMDSKWDSSDENSELEYDDRDLSHSFLNTINDRAIFDVVYNVIDNESSDLNLLAAASGSGDHNFTKTDDLHPTKALNDHDQDDIPMTMDGTVDVPIPRMPEEGQEDMPMTVDSTVDVPIFCVSHGVKMVQAYLSLWKADIAFYLKQMMFVSGETGEPSIETTTLVEEIVQQQVKEILVKATELANRAGTRSIAIEHLFFLIRHDKAKVSRLRTFLSWKDVRKNVKDSDDKQGGGGADDFTAGAADDLAPQATQNPAEAAAKGINKHKRAKIRLPWDIASYYQYQLPERDDDEDEEEEEINSATLQRLRTADERTKGMTREEYVHWSECRQASFTFRKGKRFREWAGFGLYTDSKPNDDIVDILGFLTFEIVQRLTEVALKVKAGEDAYNKKNSRNRAGGDGGNGDANGDDDGNGSRKRKRDMDLFDPPQKERTPVQTRHVREAFRRLQAPSTLERAFNFHRHSAIRPKQLKLI